VGVLFSPQTYYLTWAQEGSATRAARALCGYCRALIRRSIPYLVVEEEHLDVLSDLKVLFMPRTIVTSEATQQRLAAFVEAGGTLVCESECGAFSPQGIYRYPEDRFVAEMAGIREVGRRDLQPDTMEVVIDRSRFKLQLSQWMTPMPAAGGGIFAEHADGALVVEAPVGKGRVVLCGSYLADEYLTDEYPDFEGFVELLACRAGHQPQIEVISPQPEHDAFVYTRTGTAAGKRVIFVFFPPQHDTVQLRIAPGFLAGDTCTELLTGTKVGLTDEFAGKTCTVGQARCRLAVLVEQ
jgi:beta-galactosidase